MVRFAIFCLLFLGLVSSASAQAAIDKIALARLSAAYAPQPQGYPTGPKFARPDSAVPFRWHFYHDTAVARFDKARMLAHVEPFNPLEGAGVKTAAKSGVGLEFVAEHVTEGKKALRARFPAATIQAGQASLRIDCVVGSQGFSQYLKARGGMTTASSYRPHYRWIKLDVFNPTNANVHVRVSGAPFVLHPGANVLAVKTADSVDRGYTCTTPGFAFLVTAPAQEVILFLDHVRVEQEVPEVLSQRGRLLQFPGRSEASDAPVVWPGFTPILADTLYTAERGVGWTLPAKKRYNGAHTFRSMENGLLWGWCQAIDSPLRVDVPPGRYGVFVFGAPYLAHDWAKGLNLKVHGQEQRLLAPRSPAEVRQTALSGETWDFRPGSCVWEELVRPVYYPALAIAYAEARDSKLLLELPASLALHALIVFPEADREEALRELGRLNYLMAESWDVSHPWVRASYAVKTGDGKPYLGVHEEMLHPERIGAKLAALQLKDEDVRRGFLLFQRGLTEGVFPDTIPAPAEVESKKLHCRAAPGESICMTLGLLPLASVSGLQVTVSDLEDKGGVRLPASSIDIRVSRQHQKCMQFGHHNHDYNYEEHYLIRRPGLDLHPGAARRLYLDVPIPDKTPPGEYVGRVTIRSAQGKPLAERPLIVEVLPLRLATPPVFFASSLADPHLQKYGFNTFATTYDDAVKHGYRGYLANCGHVPIPFKGQKVGWATFLDHKGVLTPILREGKAGKGPRGFFGGPAPDTYGKPNAEQLAQAFFARVTREFPDIDLLGRTFPAFHIGGPNLQLPHEWIYLAAPPRKATGELLEAAAKSGKPFWFIDGLRHTKEQAGRFTFGVWLWRLGAQGRFTTLEALLQYGGGTARTTFPWHPYYTLLDVNGCNIDRALMPSLDEQVINHSRDLILLRAGIDDYRYLFTLDQAIRRAEEKKVVAAAVAAARKFRADLREGLSLDLQHYYEMRVAAYGENWFMRPENSWTPARFDQVRRDTADHILALNALLQE